MGNVNDCCAKPDLADQYKQKQGLEKKPPKSLMSFQGASGGNGLEGKTADPGEKTNDEAHLEDAQAEPEAPKYFEIDAVESALDDMKDFLWDGPEDSDEEIESLARLKLKHEEEEGIKFSKRGIIAYIEAQVQMESTVCDKRWQEKSKTPSMSYYLKNGGSKLSKTQPYLRSELTYVKALRIQKLAKFVSILPIFLLTLIQL